MEERASVDEPQLQVDGRGDVQDVIQAGNGRRDELANGHAVAANRSKSIVPDPTASEPRTTQVKVQKNVSSIDDDPDHKSHEHRRGRNGESARRFPPKVNQKPTDSERCTASVVYRATLAAAGFASQGKRSCNGTAGRQSPAGSSAWSAELSEQYALLESLANAAAEAVDVRTASGLAAACIPVAMRLNPQHFAALRPAIPLLVVGCQSLARRLYRGQRRGRLRQLPVAIVGAIDWLAEQTFAGPLRRVDVARAMSRAAGELCVEASYSTAATHASRQQVDEPWN